MSISYSNYHCECHVEALKRQSFNGVSNHQFVVVEHLLKALCTGTSMKVYRFWLINVYLIGKCYYPVCQ